MQSAKIVLCTVVRFSATQKFYPFTLIEPVSSSIWICTLYRGEVEGLLRIALQNWNDICEFGAGKEGFNFAKKKLQTRKQIKFYFLVVQSVVSFIGIFHLILIFFSANKIEIICFLFNLGFKYWFIVPPSSKMSKSLVAPDPTGQKKEGKWMDIAHTKETQYVVNHAYNSDMLLLYRQPDGPEEPFEKIPLKPAQAYMFRVAAVNSVGVGKWSEVIFKNDFNNSQMSFHFHEAPWFREVEDLQLIFNERMVGV